MIDPAIKAQLHSIESHLNQLMEFKVIDEDQVCDLMTYACDCRDVDVFDFMEEHW